MLIALHKPYGVLSQFTSIEGKRTLAELIPVRDVYPAGRLDFDSEGLLLLTDEGALQHAIAAPDNPLVKRYWAQIEGIPEPTCLEHLASGVDIGSGDSRYRTRPASVAAVPTPPSIEERVPPIRWRAHIPTSWLEIGITEGKNRQVRRMTAAIGHPTLRLIRVGVGPLDLFELGLSPGAWRNIAPAALGLASRSAPGVHGFNGKQPEQLMSTGLRKRRYWG